MQTKAGKGIWYFSWGYNRNWFSKSDIRFTNNNAADESGNGVYDFTLTRLSAKDRPNFEDVFTKDITVPQFNARIGYYFNDKHDFGIEMSYDHAKYVMVENTPTHLKGTIHNIYYDQDTIVTPHWLSFEHTNGANYWMMNFVKKQTLIHSINNKHWLSAVVKPGGGIVFPRTDVTLWGIELNNRLHVAGYIFGIETGLRYEAFRHYFAELTFKGVYANYLNSLTVEGGKASHHFWGDEAILTVGYQFSIGN